MYIMNGIAYAGTNMQNVLVQAVKPLDDMMMIVTFTSGEKRLYDATQLLVYPANNIAFGSGCVNAKGLAETGLRGTSTGHRNDHAMLTAVLVVGVLGIHQKYTVKDLKALDVAGANTENNEIFALLAGVNDLNRLSFHLEIHQVFGLGEEKVLGAAYCIQRVRKGHTLLPLGKDSAAIGINGQIELALPSNGRKETVQLVQSNFTHGLHLFLPPHGAQDLPLYN